MFRNYIAVHFATFQQCRLLCSVEGEQGPINCSRTAIGWLDEFLILVILFGRSQAVAQLKRSHELIPQDQRLISSQHMCEVVSESEIRSMMGCSDNRFVA